MKCKQRNRCNSNMMRVTSTLALATGLLFPAPIAIQASGMQNANISVQQDNVTTGRIIDENGEPLIGVTVRVLKGNTGTVTDIYVWLKAHNSKSLTLVTKTRLYEQEARLRCSQTN